MRTREEQARDMAADIEGVEAPNGNLVRLMTKELAEAERRAEQRVRAEIARELKNPECVHINMLRGEIAAPSWEQLLHLFPKEYENIRRDSERLDWLLAHSHYGIPGFDPVVSGRASEKRRADLIRAIDAAREGG